MGKPSIPEAAPGATRLVTIAVPIPEAVTVVAPPPALITKRNAAHMGMTGAEIVRLLRDMRADARFRGRVLVRGKSFRAASPEAILEYLHTSRQQAPSDTDHEGDRVLRSLGYEPPPRASARRERSSDASADSRTSREGVER